MRVKNVPLIIFCTLQAQLKTQNNKVLSETIKTTENFVFLINYSEDVNKIQNFKTFRAFEKVAQCVILILWYYSTCVMN